MAVGAAGLWVPPHHSDRRRGRRRVFLLQPPHRGAATGPAGGDDQADAFEFDALDPTKPIPEERATTSESATDEEKSGGESESEAKADDSGAEEATPAAEQPSREKAVAKALSRCDKGWVTKVMKHSDDWTTATIAVGPPASEWVAEFDLKWNGSDYDIVAERGE